MDRFSGPHEHGFINWSISSNWSAVAIRFLRRFIADFHLSGGRNSLKNCS